MSQGYVQYSLVPVPDLFKRIQPVYPGIGPTVEKFKIGQIYSEWCLLGQWLWGRGFTGNGTVYTVC